MQAAKDLATNTAAPIVSVAPDSLKQAATNAVSTGRVLAKLSVADLKEILEVWVKQKIHSRLKRLVDTIPGIVKNSLEDPDMPRPVSRAKDTTVDAVWPDVRQEILWEIAVLLDGQAAEEEEDFGAACCLCRFMRYHLFPCDKSFWGQLRDPVYIVFTLISLMPITGLCPLIYFSIFLIIDRGDTYQLIQFILKFKGTQFLSHGIIRTLTGFFIYIGCVTTQASEWDHTCEENGPGMAERMEIIIGGWVLQVVLVWAAFILLPWSKDKGRSQLGGKIEYEQPEGQKRPGGALLYFLLWDMISFLACTGCLLWVASNRPVSFAEAYKDWAVQHTFFACQMVYGYLSMPFFFFTLPLLKAVLTHAVPTAYNSSGICCKLKSPEKKKKRPEEPPKQEIVSEDDGNSILAKVKAIFMKNQVSTEGP